MKRRTFLKALAAVPLAVAGLAVAKEAAFKVNTEFFEGRWHRIWVSDVNRDYSYWWNDQTILKVSGLEEVRAGKRLQHLDERETGSVGSIDRSTNVFWKNHA